MRRKLISLTLAAAIMASLTGCAKIFEKEYFSAADYDTTDTEVLENGATEVKSYFSLKLAISELIKAHEESGVLDFRQYDGDINNDIAAACKEVGSNTALGAYSVDYITYDIDRIIAYYEAEISISYKRSAEEIENIITISTSDSLCSCIESALESFSESLVVMVNASLIGGEEAAEYVENECRNNPLLCVNKPEVRVDVYTGGGLQKIFDISFNYGDEIETLKLKREELNGVVSEISQSISTSSQAYRAFLAASYLLSRCSFNDTAGTTAYSALIESSADSEGMAMAYKAICSAAEIPCQVVSGRMNSEPHYWNIIEAEGAWYHVDVSRAMADGFAQTFLLSDTDMLGSYWWDIENYPSCEGNMSYSSVVPKQ